MKVKLSAIIRCAVLLLVLINQAVAVLSATLARWSVVYQILSLLLTVLSSVCAAWKNNDFTLFAKIAGKLFDALKDGKITADEAEKLVEDITNSTSDKKE